MDRLISFVEKILIVVIYAVVVSTTLVFMWWLLNLYGSEQPIDTVVIIGGVLGAVLGCHVISLNKESLSLFCPSMRTLLFVETPLVLYPMVAALIGWLLGLIFVPTIGDKPLWFYFMLIGIVAGLVAASFRIAIETWKDN